MIANGADLKNVQEIGGWKTLPILMGIYAKMDCETKRQAVNKLSYGQGAVAPAHVVEYPETVRFPVPVGHQAVAKPAAAAVQSA